MIWYRVFFGGIKEVEVTKETKNTIWIKGTYDPEYNIKTRKFSSTSSYFKTKKEAYEYLKGSLRDEIAIAERKLNSKKKQLEMFLREYPDSM